MSETSHPHSDPRFQDPVWPAESTGQALTQKMFDKRKQNGIEIYRSGDTESSLLVFFLQMKV